ncbi:EpsG family protein [Erysipelothrix rhusiopathiae]|nr:EpsG family protein [Erysipelothrix rhusiopathiae]MDE8037901.1 EpsG family protein [Erysipelothrix rhusiopathiae]MDE8040904.1 EpsG family protein [Erysipelothrix rhusiopathiae]MDE8042781.1 EpsG family protein [Erysipelothrix rhusiopathiae]MDE8042987.1 EpsG family protein [Erysipelothrix rhusiopathiae]
MILFSLVMIVLISIYEFTELNKKKVFYLILFIVITFSALRYGIGYDYRNYILRIHGMPLFKQLPLMREFFSYALFWVSHLLGNPQIFFATNAILTNFLIFYTIKEYSIDIPKSIWVYLTFPMFFLNSLSIVRNFTAFSIVFYSFKFIKGKDFSKFIACVILAALFHNSALFIIPLYWLYDLKLGRKAKILSAISIFVSVPILQMSTRILLPSYSDYFTKISDLKAGRATLIVLIAILLISLLFEKRLVKNNKDNQFYINSLFFAVLVYITYAKFGHFAFRMTEYLYIFILLLIPELIFVITNLFDEKMIYFKHPTKLKYVFLLSFYLVFGIMFFYMIRVGGAAYYPYKMKIYSFFDSTYYIPFLK